MQSTPPATQAIWFDEFAATSRDLLHFLRRRTGSDDTARDLAQDAWLRVAENHASGDGSACAPATPDHARAWLFTVAERLAIDHLRRQHHWQAELAPRLSATQGHAPDVAESHAYAQALHAVDRALATMPARMREVFVAHRLEGVPHDELAQRHAVSRKTIEREITRAMDLAQAALAQDAVAPVGKVHALAGANQAAPRQGRRKALGALLGVAGLGSSASVAWQLWREWVPQWQTAFATSAGRIGRLPLPDGSELTLDADSAVNVRLLAGRREVQLLRGGAFFDVARDTARPFIVLAGPARVTVLGTRFSVEMGPRGVDVAVESGRVAVQGLAQGPAPQQPLELRAGEAARVGAGGTLEAAPARAAESVAPWRTGWLAFDNLPLGEAAARLNRYRPGAPVRVGPAAAALPVLARVNIARSNQWLQSLPAVLPVSFSADADGGVTLRRR
ncbi:sigma-70 family RNA polymerase sigma factor [Sphaerotilus sp.]|uniref:sigma-70 family RNA polymerase sigma factor n=1 Tax=Sphaerotilus sp. TaxID=2093942 RepID=UPI002ACD2232|nr:sigma-70 family RNA polymerase sigma factor [Sphaerotilus sp.]MDZ7855897.1 sigma-70 family RNA polymerase sigma factor [Sphaerotilus sp.]